MNPGHFEIGGEVRHVVFLGWDMERALVELKERGTARVKTPAPRTRS